MEPLHPACTDIAHAAKIHLREKASLKQAKECHKLVLMNPLFSVSGDPPQAFVICYVDKQAPAALVKETKTRKR